MLVEKIPKKALPGKNYAALWFILERGVSTCPRWCYKCARNSVLFASVFLKKVLPLVFSAVFSVLCWCRFVFPAMLLTLGGCCVDVGSNAAVNADGLQPSVTLIR